MIVVLTGPVQSGKTTALARALDLGVVRARGVLQPVLDGQRVVVDAATGEQRPLEAPPDAGPGVVHVGRFRFSADALSWARGLVEAAAAAAGPDDWVVIDEVGPLELMGNGLAPAVHRLIASSRRPDGPRALLVVRDWVVSEVRQAYSLRPDAVKYVTVGELLAVLT